MARIHHRVHMRAQAITDLSGREAPVRRLSQPRIVPCPECKAEVGQPCMSSTGRVSTRVHVSRERMAARALRAQREAAASGTQEA